MSASMIKRTTTYSDSFSFPCSCKFACVHDQELIGVLIVRHLADSMRRGLVQKRPSLAIQR
eukprot:m.164237 g.164237  ORF g.164237 m.164237 type:complete len:61 (-) comp14398_c0_seq8:2835-3017(-)